MYNWYNGRIFYNFEQPSDLNPKLWWQIEPIYLTAQKVGAPTALFYFPECEVIFYFQSQRNPTIVHNMFAQYLEINHLQSGDCSTRIVFPAFFHSFLDSTQR